MRRFTNSAVLVLAFASVAVSGAVIAQPPASGTFITMLGKDTVAVEQYTRTAEGLIGDYVTRPGQTVVNHYTVHFLADGNPGHVILSQTLANGATIPGAPKGVQLTIGATESVIAIERDTMINRKFAMSKTFPLLGTSFGMLELAFARLRAEHTDSGTFPGLPLDSKVQPDPIPVKFFGADSDPAVFYGTVVSARSAADDDRVHTHCDCAFVVAPGFGNAVCPAQSGGGRFVAFFNFFCHGPNAGQGLQRRLSSLYKKRDFV